MPVVSPIATVGIDAHVPEGGILPVNEDSILLESGYQQ